MINLNMIRQNLPVRLGHFLSFLERPNVSLKKEPILEVVLLLLLL